jgi:hypothetical protein
LQIFRGTHKGSIYQIYDSHRETGYKQALCRMNNHQAPDLSNRTVDQYLQTSKKEENAYLREHNISGYRASADKDKKYEVEHEERESEPI